MKGHITDEEWEKQKREHRKEQELQKRLKKMNEDLDKNHRKHDNWVYGWGSLLAGVGAILMFVFLGDDTNVSLLGYILYFLFIAFLFGFGLINLKKNRFLKKIESGNASEEEISSKQSKIAYISIFLLFVFGFIILAASIYGFLSGRTDVVDIIFGLFGGVFAIGLSVWLFSKMRKVKKFLNDEEK
jgi:Ca2+/Na+ antiporter